ncbi:MAG TPA: S41 family peptidase [Phycisphaerae bacterium]|nr:S41 family peptidase [Phycisphaerae bacterium]
MVLLAVVCASWIAGCAAPPRTDRLTDEQRELNLQSFDYAWETIRDTHWDPQLGGVDWEAIRDELRPQVEQAEFMSQARGTMNEMVRRLGQSHFAVIPSSAYGDLHEPSAKGEGPRDGATGMEIRAVDGHILVTAVEPGSPADEAGVRPGWLITSVNGTEVDGLVETAQEAYEDPGERQSILSRSVARRLRGTIGDSVSVGLLDGRDRAVDAELALTEARGNRVRFGSLPPLHVWFESRLLEGDVGYIRFNAFLDVVRVMQAFGEAVKSFHDCPGVIIDLRGNMGGLGPMAMGMAGWFVRESDLCLGTMITRTVELKFFVNPRIGAYDGPVVILVDGLTGSTAEIFAGGMKDLGQARIFGSRTAGAALPAHIERLPNGDGFLHAVANYVSAGGQTLEGTGVVPDEPVEPLREELLEGRDAILEAALRWIRESYALETAVLETVGS